VNRSEAITALRATGELLQRSGQVESVSIILGGAVAAMVTADLPASRITLDCDVVDSQPDDGWSAVQQAARQVAAQRSLPANWLNRDSRMYIHYLPLGWRDRCEPVGQFGPLTVLAVSRRDLMAMKLMGAAVRPQDLEDIVAMRPTRDDLAFLHEHLDRLDAESLSRETHDTERAIVNELEPTDEQG